MTDPKILAQSLRQERLRQQLSQDSVADEAGLSIRTLQRAENQGLVSPESLEAICTVLKISTSDLIKDATKPLASPLATINFTPTSRHRFFWLFFFHTHLDLLCIPLFIMAIYPLPYVLGIWPTSNITGMWGMMLTGGSVSLIPIVFSWIGSKGWWDDDRQKYQLFQQSTTFFSLLDEMESVANDATQKPQQAATHLLALMARFEDQNRSILPTTDPVLKTHLLDYLKEDLDRGVSPRKNWATYIIAQRTSLRLIFEKNTRLQEDLAIEEKRLREGLAALV